MAVDLDDGGVDQGVFHIRLVRAGLKKPDEDIGFDPIPVSLEHGVPAPERRRKIPPWAARAHDPQHRFQKKPVIAPAAPRVRRLAAAVGLHLRPLGVSQNESIHPELESRASSGGNPESQHALANIGARSFNSLGKRMPRFPWGSGGGGGIRTRDTVSRIHTFQACAFDRSATPPACILMARRRRRA